MTEMAITNSLFQNASELEMETGVITVALSNVPPFVAKSVSRVTTVETRNGDISDSAAEALLQDLRQTHTKRTDKWQIDTIDVVFICVVLVILIRAVTIIALKRGFSFSKGNTTLSVGEKKKTKRKTKPKKAD